IIIISGAGISTNTGIPDYQSSSRSNNSSQIVYHTSAYSTQETADMLHNDLLQKLRLGQGAMFTMFDTFAEGLAQSGRLRRHYAQNIDCRQSRLAHLSRKTVWLHDRADTLVCHIRASHTMQVTPESFPRWAQASCPSCEEEQSKRRRDIGILRISVLLYGEDSPSESKIITAFNYDLEYPVDAILIIGTRLLTPSL
ncbi:DHS-like NAD/FAD-binding domain-containing protein, partial [Ilyonectria sp. MPI-CAGE-AT-0026]